MAIILDGSLGESNASWTTSGRPSNPSAGQMGFNTTLGAIETYNGSAWYQAGRSGNVLQCLQYGEYTGGTLSSSTFVQLGSMTLSITPTSATSKVLAIVSLPALYLQFSTNPAHCYTTLYRNGTNLDTTGGSFGFSLVSGNTTSGNNWANSMFTYLDSPATTSSTTYAVYVKNISGTNGGTVLGEGSSRATLTLMEIAA